jgi:hypothetical protein
MRIKMLLASMSIALMTIVLPSSVFAEKTAPAQLRLLVVDQNNVALPHATVTLFGLDGKPGVTVTADEKGVALFTAVSTGMTQIVAKRAGFTPYIEKTTVQPGSRSQTITLRAHAGES